MIEDFDSGKLVPDDFSALSSTYVVKASEITRALDDNAFILSLPVPEGVDPVSLQVVFRTTDPHNSEQTIWHPKYGVFDAQTRNYKVRLPNLTTDPELLFFLAAGSGSTLDRIEPRGDALELQSGVPIKVNCKGRNCNYGKLSQAAAEFQRAYNDYTGMGFKRPELEQAWFSSKYIIHLISNDDSSCKGRNGFYRPLLEDLHVCVSSNTNFTSSEIDTLRHEYFHATQYAYKGINLEYSSRGKYLKEGTATLAENSTATATVVDTTRNPMPVDRPFEQLEDLMPYRTQDFWDYLESRIAPGQGLNYLIKFFDSDPSLGSISNTITSFKSPTTLNLRDAYWDFAQNQVFEKVGLDHASNRYGAPCSYNEYTTSRPIIQTFKSSADVADWSHSVKLAPLESRVYELNFEPRGVDMTYYLNFTRRQRQFVRLAYAEAGANPCFATSKALGPVGTFKVNFDEPAKKVYVLVSNAEFNFYETYTLDVKAVKDNPELLIGGPTGTLYETDVIRLYAQLTDMKPDGTNVVWSYRAGGTNRTAYSKPNETFEIPVLCDGRYTVQASLNTPGGRLTNEKTFTVVDDPSGKKPPECFTNVKITSPTPNLKVKDGEKITFEATLTPGSLEENPTFHTPVWRWVNNGGLIISRGNLVFERSKFGPGEHTVSVTYGPASDDITFRIE